MDVSFNDTIDEASMDMGDMDVDKEAELNASCRFPRRHSAKLKKLCAKEERNASLKRVSSILQKSEDQRTLEDTQTLQQCSEEVEEVQSRWKKRDEAKRRLEEFEEPMESLQEKCQILAQAIAQSQHLVVYTGAGISTAARIPDYRGSNGIWTRLQQGKEIGNHDLSLAEPTYTHMALSQLYHQNILKYVVSQNCDGLHLRSGLPRNALSELHGNMYIEVCKSCKPAKEYWRLFDVTENTARYSHKTMRKCYMCNQPLVDTIVHFGERGTLQWPLNWSGASKNAQKATTILCLGSSLKVLKRYPWLWQMDKPVKKRPNLYIVNLQWTPKDDCANVKLHGKCDVVMRIVMNFLGIAIKPYDRIKDPIFYHATQLSTEELHTTTQPTLKCEDVYFSDQEPEVVPIETKQEDLSDDGVKSEDHSSEIQSVLQDCDNTSNTQGRFKSDKAYISNNSCFLNQISVLNSNTSDKSINNQKCNFSIDSILQSEARWSNENIKVEQDDVKQQNGIGSVGLNSSFLNNGLILPQNYTAAFLAYYRFREALLLQNPILSYQDMLYYPYQTSFLYSGFHSIINPLPHLNTNSKINDSEAKILDNKIIKADELDKINVEVSACKFCRQEYKSMSCSFYTKSESIFVKHDYNADLLSKKAIVCLCCEYSTDEDEEIDKKDSTLEESEVSEVTKSSEKDDENDKEQKEVKIQAGWFGKGYRKIKKPRKR